MFDSAALDHSLDKAEFEKLATQLRVDLLAAQAALAETAPLNADERRARAGLISRQVNLR